MKRGQILQRQKDSGRVDAHTPVRVSWAWAASDFQLDAPSKLVAATLSVSLSPQPSDQDRSTTTSFTTPPGYAVTCAGGDVAEVGEGSGGTDVGSANGVVDGVPSRLRI